MALFRKHNLFGIGNAKNPVLEFTTAQELMDIPILKEISQVDNFSHFAVSENCIMSIHDDGFVWWVVGYTDAPEATGFPQWDRGKYRVTIGSASFMVSGVDVMSTCGDEVRMRDGRMLHKARGL